MKELEKALAGLPYDSRSKEIADYQLQVKKACYTLDQLPPDDPRRQEILANLVSGYNPYVFIESGFRCVFGKNIHFQGMAMLHYNCTLLDSDTITIGDGTLIGPGCQILCTNHAIDAEERLMGVFRNQPVTIGDRVWIGAGAILLPGVTIGDEAVIGAGSVVTMDIPARTVAVGNPCKIVRSITAQDKTLRKWA